MAKKSKFLKNLLTSASAATLVLSAASSAYAETFTTTGAFNVRNGTDPVANATPTTKGVTVYTSGDNISTAFDVTATGELNIGVLTVTGGGRTLAAGAHAVTVNSIAGGAPNVIDATIGTGSLTLSGNTLTGLQNINFTGNGTLNVASGATLVGAIDNTSGVDNRGNINFAGSTTLTNVAIGATNTANIVTIGSGQTGTVVADRGAIRAAEIRLANDSTLRLSLNGGDVNHKGNIVNSSGTNNQGVLEVEAKTAHLHSVEGDIGADGAALKKIQFNSDQELVVVGNQVFAETLASNDGTAKGELRLIATAAKDAFTLSGNTQANGLRELAISSKTVANTTKVTIAKGSNQKYNFVTLDGTAATNALYIGEDGSDVETVLTAGTFTFNKNDQELWLRDGATLTVDGANKYLTANADGDGKVFVKGNATLNAGLGAVVAGPANRFIGEFNFDTAGKELKSDGTEFNINGANGVHFSKDATFTLTNDNADVTINSVVTADAKEYGTITANNLVSGKTLTVAGNIGDPIVNNKSLKKLEATNGANIALQGANNAIEELNIGSADNTTTLGNGKAALDVYVKNFAGDNEKGSIVFNDGANGITLRAGTNLGSSDKKRKEITFQANSAVDVEDGVNFHALNGLRNNNAGDVTLNFAGDSEVDAVVGANNKFAAINVQGANKTVKFLKDVNVTGNIDIVANATAEFSSNIAAANLQGNAVNSGNVIFRNTDAINVDTPVGAVQLNSVELAGGNVKFMQRVNANELKFTSENATTATFQDRTGFAVASFTTTTSGHNIILDADFFPGADPSNFMLTSAVGSQSNQFGFVQINRGAAAGALNRTLELTNGTFYAGLESDVGVSGTNNDIGNSVNFNAASGRANYVGKEGKEFLNTTFTQSATVDGNVWSRNLSAVANQTATFGGDVVSSGGAFTLNNNSIATFKKDGAVVDVAISGNAASNGVVNFDGGADIRKAIGGTQKVSAINFNGNSKKNIAVAKNLTADAINVKGDVFSPSANLTLAGLSTFDGSTLNLGSNKLTIGGAAASVIKGATEFRLSFNADNTALGSVDVNGTGSTLDLAGITSLNINITDTSLLPKNEDQYDLFTVSGGGALANKLSAASTVVAKDVNRNDFVIWSYDKASNKLTRTNNAENKLKEILVSQNAQSFSADIPVYANQGNSGQAERYVNELANTRKADNTVDEARIVESLTRHKELAANASQQNADAIYKSAGAQVNSRIAGQRASSDLLASGTGTGVAAGDEHFMHGAWFMPFYNHVDQDSRSGQAGYKSSSYGATVGADTQVNADMNLGLAFTYVKSDLKHKGVISGDKTKGDTYMFSVYGTQQLTNEWFAQGSASFASTRFKTQQKRLLAVGSETAKARYDSTSFGGELLFGYDYKQDNMVLTPMFGAAYTRHNDGGYNETGTSFQNLSVKRKAANMLEAVAGAKVQFAAMDAGEMMVTPEVHGFVRHDLLRSEEKVERKLSGTVGELSSVKPKVNHTFYSAGLSLTAKQGEYEYGVGYDATFASKYVGHQGSLKLRLNF